MDVAVGFALAIASVVGAAMVADGAASVLGTAATDGGADGIV